MLKEGTRIESGKSSEVDHPPRQGHRDVTSAASMVRLATPTSTLIDMPQSSPQQLVVSAVNTLDMAAIRAIGPIPITVDVG